MGGGMNKLLIAEAAMTPASLRRYRIATTEPTLKAKQVMMRFGVSFAQAKRDVAAARKLLEKLA